MAEQLRLEVLGKFRLSLGGKELKVRFAKTQALLCYLAMTGRPHSREALAHLLWSEHEDEAARASLRVAVSELHRALPDHLVVTRGTVSFNHERPYHLDVAQLSEALRTPDEVTAWRAALAQFQGELLKGLHIANAPVFETWLAGQREELRGLVLAALQRSATYDVERGDYREAIKTLGRLLALESWREEAHRQLMRVLALSGQREAAVAQYLTCCHVLADELGLEPALETTELYEQIRAGKVGGSIITPSAPPPPVAERRQLTVMSCDLLGVGALSDPEELHERVSFYHQAVSKATTRFEGFVAGRQGPSVSVYFGYPFAHEDDAQRAVRTGLELLETLRGSPLALAARIGIHTGTVVVADGEVGPEVVGLTPVAAQRLQNVSGTNELLISGATEPLVRGYFTTEALGSRLLEGLAAPLELHRVLKETAARSRLQATPPKTALVGRERELSGLLKAWERASKGQSQAILVTGEAGIGKSRLLYAFKEALEDGPCRWLETHSAAYQASSPFYPLIDLLERQLGFVADTPEEKLDKLEVALVNFGLPPSETLPLLALLLSLPFAHRHALPNLSPERQRQATLEVLVRWFTAEAARVPVVFVLEDLHWCDPSTLALLERLMETGTARLLLLLTARPEFDPVWLQRSQVAHLKLDSLPPEEAVTLIKQLTAGTLLPPTLLEQLVAKSDGVPLYLEELTKGVLETEGRARQDGTTVPSTLQGVLTARLDRLGEAKEVAQLAAVVGRDFSLDLLTAASATPEMALRHALDRLVEAGLVYLQGGQRYGFKHALVQNAAYASLLKRKRQGHHAQVARVLTESAAAERQPELLAQHYGAAGLIGEAIHYWQRAAARALARSAHQEAVHHLHEALKVLTELPDTRERHEQELALLLGLGAALHAAKGYAAAEVEAVYSRARALCESVGESPRRFTALLGLSGYYTMRAQYPAAWQLVQQLLDLPRHLLTELQLCKLHFIASRVKGFQGELAASLAHAESVMSLPDPPPSQSAAFTGISPQDDKISAFGFSAMVLWLLGYPERALVNLKNSLAHAEGVDYLYLQAFTLLYAVQIHLARRETHKAKEHLEALMTLAIEQRFMGWSAYGRVWQGALQVEAGQREGLALIRDGLDLFDAQGTVTHRPFLLGFYASAQHQMGRLEPALETFNEALAQVETTGERWWEAELHRLKGELLLDMDCEEVEIHLRKAVAVAKAQEAKSLELRATVSLAHLLQQQGDGAEARLMLNEIYGWFTEGLDTRDLLSARALLETLSSSD